MENDKLINDLLQMSEMNSMSLWKRDVCKRAADALSIPAVDAVPMDFHDQCMQIEIRKRMEVERSRPEVVRCGDCVHLNGEFGNMSGYFRCDVFDAWQKDTERAYMPLDGFCYLGQRREDGDGDG